MIDETKLNEMHLPRANYYEELETLSEQNLQLLFHPSRFHLCSKDRRDKGIDLAYEIIHANNHVGFRFVIQLKATENIKPNLDDDSLSVSMETSNINYLLNNNCTAFYVLYDRRTDVFYYESVIEFLRELIDKGDSWETQSSHVLRFKKKLLPERVTEIYEATLRMGLLQRNLKESAIRILASANQADRISLDANLTLTDDGRIREMIELGGFELINEGKWSEIIYVSKKASGNVATTGLYNLILGIANYYSGSRWDAISFLKKASNLKQELSEETQMQLKYFDTSAKYSIGLLSEENYNDIIHDLEASATVGLYVRLGRAKAEYVESIDNPDGEHFDEYMREIIEIVNHPKANSGLILTAKCELLLFQGLKNNSDYLKAIANINAIEELHDVNVEARVRFSKEYIEINNAWYKDAEDIIAEAQLQKNKFALFTAYVNQVKVAYQFKVYSSKVFVVKELPGYPKPEKPDDSEMIERLIKRIELASTYFADIEHVENTITAYSTMYEILHYKNDMDKAEIVMKDLDNIIKKYDFPEFKRKLEFLKNGGTTHESLDSWINKITDDAVVTYKEQSRRLEELQRMDEEEAISLNKYTPGNYVIHLFPIGYFQFHPTCLAEVFNILRVESEEVRKSFSTMFETLIPVANILCNPITEEGYLNGKLADQGIKSRENIYRIRKAFYEKKFYRFEPTSK